MGKQRRVELKSVGKFVAKTVLVESANQFSLEELCRTQYSLKYFFRSHVDHQTYGKTLSVILTRRETMNKLQLKSFWRDQTCELIKIFLLHMRVAIMMFYRMNIT